MTSVDHENAKKTLQRIFSDGQLNADKGRYSPRTPGPGVPESPDTGTEGNEGQEYSQTSISEEAA